MATTNFVPASTTLPASITSPPTIRFTPPPECNDPANNWIVTTSCYVELAYGIEYPDWLTCTIYDFGAPAWSDPSCHIPQPTDFSGAPKVTVDDTVSYYSGCPVGYTAARNTTYPGYYTWSYEDIHFDATAYSFQCCPTQYDFKLGPTGSDPRQMTNTIHNGVNYSLFIYRLPGCAATSISQLSVKEIPVQTWSNDMAWDKRQIEILVWDYEHGTMFANPQQFSFTVFRGTHTCYESCDSWFTYCKYDVFTAYFGKALVWQYV
ncbi:hypothetical protein F4678DRAFT_465491 [Xylaria arbuscula]|nr:hypothetical protein F4678DRAFT_465491 [Xylaria arbuscula]